MNSEEHAIHDLIQNVSSKLLAMNQPKTMAIKFLYGLDFRSNLFPDMLSNAIAEESVNILPEYDD